MGSNRAKKQPTKRLYECDDCKHHQMVAWVELNRAAKPACQVCGCTRLELVSEQAKEDRCREQAMRVQGEHSSMKLGSHAKKRKKQVR